MDTLSKARRVVGDAEAKLRGLIEEALREQRYADVASVAHLADGLARLLNGPISASPRLGSFSLSPKQSNASGAAKSKNGTKHSGSRSTTSKERPGKSYPRFKRDGNRLVKVGWSKKAKAEYEHRAPHEAVLAFARHLAANVAVDKVFVVEDLLPVPDMSGGELPAYQVYLTLAWLRDAGIVEKKGRDGYVLRSNSLMEGQLDELWGRMPSRSA